MRVPMGYSHPLLTLGVGDLLNWPAWYPLRCGRRCRRSCSIVRCLRISPLLLLGALSLPAQDLKEFEKKITEFTLPNGLHFILLERHEAPVVSFHTFVRAGSANDPAGETGLAHMFEHMAFKGTETIGSRDWAAEKRALDAVEEAYDRL